MSWGKLAGGLFTALVVLGALALGGLRLFNVFGQASLGGACTGRMGCLSYQCLRHERVADRDVESAGYCTAPCESDGDCDAPAMRCVVPSPAALDDLPRFGRPDKLCQRVR